MKPARSFSFQVREKMSAQRLTAKFRTSTGSSISISNKLSFSVAPPEIRPPSKSRKSGKMSRVMKPRWLSKKSLSSVSLFLLLHGGMNSNSA